MNADRMFFCLSLCFARFVPSSCSLIKIRSYQNTSHYLSIRLLIITLNLRIFGSQVLPQTLLEDAVTLLLIGQEEVDVVTVEVEVGVEEVVVKEVAEVAEDRRTVAINLLMIGGSEVEIRN